MIKEIIFFILICCLFGVIIWGFYELWSFDQERICSFYEEQGFKTKIDINLGCQIYFKGEYKTLSEIKKYLEVKRLKEELQ